MEQNSYPGKFIVFEGLDGSGQSTQVKLLTEFLKEKGHKVLETKEPTRNSKAGKKIRKILDKKTQVEPVQLQELFTEDRKWHLKNVIIPALKKDKIVISDRYFFSSFSYGMAEGLSLKQLIKLNDKFLLPDSVFFLDVKPKICLQRIKNRGEEKTLFEKEKKLEKVYQNYKRVFKKFETKIKIYFIDGERSIKEVFEDVKKVIEKKMKK